MGQTFLFLCRLYKFLLKTGHFEYYNESALKIRFSLLLCLNRACFCCLLWALVIRVFSDFFNLILQILYSLTCIFMEVFVALSQQSVIWQLEPKWKKTKTKNIFSDFIDCLWTVTLLQCLARLTTTLVLAFIYLCRGQRSAEGASWIFLVHAFKPGHIQCSPDSLVYVEDFQSPASYSSAFSFPGFLVCLLLTLTIIPCPSWIVYIFKFF